MNQPSKLETLLGHTELVAVFADGSSEPVKVRQLHIAQYPQYQRTMENEAAMADLLCGKPDGWSLGLSLQSFEEIILAGDRINADFFARWQVRDMARKRALLAGLGDETIHALAAERPSPSPTLLPRRPVKSD